MAALLAALAPFSFPGRPSVSSASRSIAFCGCPGTKPKEMLKYESAPGRSRFSGACGASGAAAGAAAGKASAGAEA
eukprot:11363372-Alexandrium_andersonii.AAC.1